ncbi:5-deoxy-glucuronate isomerase [Microbacterium oryzae]|uniref:5-deoxy-glucuronate isomerase n=1 Tax=Microbacterium oryzae TaxID=743009 RepID=A0A6I6DSS0_9MICO|nr:5-deoxy-glucuronate isomerase [Microbacterium oryzae]QGU27995.1 5-deoxy-glucuronate isomerase [Microbacterium oryzae]
MGTSTTPWLHPQGSLSDGPWETVVDDSLEGWQHTGLRVAELDGNTAELPAGDIERIVVPLSGSFSVTYAEEDGDEQTQELVGRPTVFSGPTDVLFLGAGTRATLTGAGRVAVAEAPTATRTPARYLPATDIAVELRGAGRSSRQVHGFGLPGAMDEPAKLLVCEVITPADNWSSYPPHKHDEDRPGHEAVLEEIYYFESSRDPGRARDDDALGVFHTYPAAGDDIRIDAVVRSGDVALVPRGYHGPAAAVPGYHLYYLNVMAGPGDARAWVVADDPAHAWVRGSWDDQPLDERLPFTR